MKSRITVKCLIWRIIFCFAGQFLCGCAIGLSVNADLGVMPGSSLAYACSLVWGMDLGLWAFILFVLMLLAQVMMLRKDFCVRDLSQIIGAVISSAFISIGNRLMVFWRADSYAERFVQLIVSLVMFAVSIAIYIDTDLLVNVPERTTLAISKKAKVSIGTAKIIMDCALVFLAIVVTWIGYGRIAGVREGTLIAALGVGTLINAIHKRVAPPIKKLCFGND